jgi:hypothetical protein
MPSSNAAADSIAAAVTRHAKSEGAPQFPRRALSWGASRQPCRSRLAAVSREAKKKQESPLPVSLALRYNFTGAIGTGRLHTWLTPTWWRAAIKYNSCNQYNK